MPLAARTSSEAAPLVHAVVLNWNGAAQTLSCLHALAAIDYPRLHVQVVDNGSTDDSVRRLRASLPDLDLLASDRNLGFAAGCNLGIRHGCAAGAEFVWLLNNDALARPGALRALVARATQDARVGAVGCHLDAGSSAAAPVWGGGRVGLVSGLPRHLVRPQDESRIEYLQGASLLLRCAALREVGVLDEGFFLYWEDTDLCFRLRRAGWHLAVASAAHVEHPGNGSLRLRSPEWDFHFTASSVRFLRRHAPWPVVPITVSVAGRIAKRALRGRWQNVRAVVAGLHAARSRRAGLA